jgi:hypothetical protein
VTYSANGLGPFQTSSNLPNPFQIHNNFQRISQHTSVPDINGTRYTTQPPLLQPPAPLWAPRDTWTQQTMANDARSGRQNSPPFEETKVLRDMVNYRGHHVLPDIQASIPKGFFEVEGKWTCYRRNYFPVLCSFTTKPSVPDGAYYLQRDGNQLTQIVQFAVSISAKTAVVSNQESQIRGLVQHTPKRDKATESTPGRVIIQPSTQMSPESRHPAIHSYSSPHTVSPNMISHYEQFSGGQQQSPPIQHTFERIQFQKATANNGKRRAQQQFFHVVVELWADIGHGNSDWVELATRQSAQMVVRGRSPGHYKDNGRRNSNASMDPDRGSGSGGDSIFHSNGPPFGSHSQNNGGMEWTQTGGGGSHHYGSGIYRRHADICSPESDDSSEIFTESHTEVESCFKASSRIESPIEIDCKASESQYEAGPKFKLGSSTNKSSRKRPYEEEHALMPSMLETRRPYHVDAFLPSHLDYSSSQPLSVS